MSSCDILDRYNALKKLVTKRKAEFDNLINFIENETTWLTAPASSRYHLCKEGGLLVHSVNVAETLLKLKGNLAPEISDESCVIVALLHDLGKVGMPGQPLYQKNDPSEKQQRYGFKPDYPYRLDYTLTYLSIPVRSLYLAQRHLTLSEEEVQAIVYHDGQYVEDNRSCARREKPLTLLLQYADSWSGFVIEK
ncbi:MAG: hypothetical protein DDT26_01830 [Dehalococcoidia bacterium]|nr:hypothetical protein [Chloroflexota bacterium]